MLCLFQQTQHRLGCAGGGTFLAEGLGDLVEVGAERFTAAVVIN
jgi:hypothetical protein